MANRLAELWAHLSGSPLLWLTVTLGIYQGADWLYRRSGNMPLLNPVLTSIAVTVALLLATGTPYETCFDRARFLHFLLGPATVALAVPLYSQLARLRQMLVPVVVALLAGSIFAMLSVFLLGRITGLSDHLLVSMLLKSVTTPIAMGVSDEIGGVPAMNAVFHPHRHRGCGQRTGPHALAQGTS